MYVFFSLQSQRGETELRVRSHSARRTAILRFRAYLRLTLAAGVTTLGAALDRARGA